MSILDTETGSWTDADDGLDKLRQFATGTPGWTQDDWGNEGDGKRLALSKSGNQFSFRSSTTGEQFSGEGIIDLEGIGISGYDGTYGATSDWHKQEKAPRNSAGSVYYFSHMLWTGGGGISNYWFYAFDNPELIVVIIEYDTNKYQWMFFGEILAEDSFTGGQIFGASLGCNTETHDETSSISSAGNSGIPLYYQGTENTFMRVDVGSFTDNWASKAWGSSVTGGELQSWYEYHDLAYQSSPNTYNSLNILIPIELDYEDSSGSLWNIAGHLNYLKIVNMTNIADEDTLTLGSETWRCFPCHVRNSTQTGYIGLAVRET